MTATKLLYGLVVAGCAMFAQAPSAPTPQVRVNVVALDSHNQPVDDLTASDFQITDQGKPQHIVSFQKAVIGTAGNPNEFTNRAAGGQTTVILFDLLNQARTNGLGAAHKLGHGLAQLKSGDSLYLYILGLDGNMLPIHPFPAPGSTPAANDKTWTQQADSEIQTAMKTVNKARKAGMTNEDFTKKTYVALETLAKDLAAFPGARDIVWITDGVPYVFPAKYQDTGCQGDWFGDCALYLPHLSVTLAGTDSHVYALTYTMSPDTNTARDMEYFSDTSGGVSLSGIEIPDVLTQIGNDEKSTYTITYEPGPDNWDKKFHKVKTTCERKGLKIQARNRYFAVPVSVAEQRAQTAPPAKDEDDAIIAALENPGDVSNIGLHVAVSPAAGKPNTLHFQIRVDAADLQLQEKAGAFDGQVAIALADYTATGLKGLPVPNEINLHLTAERHATAMKDGISIAMDHAIDGTIHFVRFILFDHARNTFGSLAIPVSLPAAPAAK